VPRKLRVEYRTEDSFRREYAQNISKGGLFIPTRHALEIRESVEIELVLAFAGESVSLLGEVVHCIPAEMAETGAQPGVAIQFLVEGDALRSKFGRFAPAAAPVDERAQGTGRRVAPRSRARVAVQVKIGRESREGHTRNISSSGVLVTIAGDPPPIGKSVEVTLRHPSTAECLVVPGKVSRHVAASGATCIGVHFQTPEARLDEVAEFVARVLPIAHSRRLGGINGPIADLGIRNVLSMFGNTAPLGMLTLTRGSEEGYITIDHGRLRAQLDSRVGREALDALLAWQHGTFEFEAQADDGLVDGDEIPVSEISGAAAPPSPPREPDARRVAHAEEEAEAEPEEGADEAASREGPLELVDLDDLDLGFDEDRHGPAPAATPAPVPRQATLRPLAGDRSELSKTEEAVLDLAAVGMTVAKALEIIPESESDVLAAIRSLVDQDLLFLG
jgi:Tfp pilus assembly protein PilZ